LQGSGVLDVFKAITTEPLELLPSVPISADLADLFTRIFDKDPATRITLPEIMAHPWVTDSGQLQLSQLGEPEGGEGGEGAGRGAPGYGAIEVTAQEAQGAIDRASLVSMIRARLKEKVFRPAEYLFRQVRGALKLVTKPRTPPQHHPQLRSPHPNPPPHPHLPRASPPTASTSSCRARWSF
jgi:hypothetical protein